MPLAGCTGLLSTLDPAGPAAASIATLWWVMFYGATVLFALVAVLLAMSYWRSGLIRRLTPLQWILGLGVGMPVVVLTALVTTAFVQGEGLLPHRDGVRPVTISVLARQWRWEFAYPESPGVGPTIGVLHMPAGVPVDLTLESADVIHGFWIPRLGGKLDAIPGHVNVVRLLADQPGRYHGVCAEFCGDGHTQMRFEVIAHAPEDYQAALEASR
ncbi:cytochrome c oxidase subunit II [Arsenicitalea aurantiaca]|uniref:cytochrome c oxidase subunit II n=1 Tax=Arsenicitalea aurantiaca TaxID=1783274 RepID=UPI001FCE3F9C|nr:cytochrome c oxidase subunit II [Arsenicitalea aurantiaca]